MSEKAASKQQPVKGDDRNLVAATESGASASAEEWLFDFWKKYRTTVIAAIVIMVAVIAGRAAVHYFQANQEAATRAAFAAAGTKEELLGFARQYEGHTLAAVALLNVGDEYYREGDYTAALKYYTEAEGLLEDKVLVDRAKLGRGMAAFHAGQTSEASQILRALADDSSATEGLRAEALYHLAAMAHEAGDDDKAIKILDELAALAPTGIWANRGMVLRSRLAPAQQEETPAVSLPTN